MDEEEEEEEEEDEEEEVERVEDEFEDDGSVVFIPVSASPPFPAQEAPPSMPSMGRAPSTSMPFPSSPPPLPRPLPRPSPPPSPPPSSPLLLRASELAESGVSCVSCVSVHSTRGSFLFVPRESRKVRGCWVLSISARARVQYTHKRTKEVHTMGRGGKEDA